MKKKIFVVSDEHGYYQELIKALNEVGYDEDNPSHLLISLGDNMDRGEESLSIYEYYKRLSDENKAIILKGNHTDMFIEWLEGPVTNFNYKMNGLHTTIDDFDHRTQSFFSWILIDKKLDQQNLTYEDWDNLWYEWSEITRNSIKEEYPELLPWLKSLPNYYESKNYIFTHGSIQTYGDWKNPVKGWDWHHWDRGDFFGENIINTNKKVIVGHFYTSKIREKYNVGELDDYSILTRDDGQIIMIDGCVPLNRKINVLVIEEEELLETNNNEKEVNINE